MDVDWLFFSFLAMLFLFGVYVWSGAVRPSNFPPGPLAFPFVGNIMTCDYNPHVTMRKLKARYGDICSIYYGRKATVVLSDFYTVRQVFKLDSVAARDTDSYVRIDASTQHRVGLTFNQGEVWKAHRRFAISTLRDLGMGKNGLEDAIIAELEDICQALSDTNQRPFDPKVLLTNSSANVICGLIFGRRFSLTDPNFVKLTKMITQNLSGFAVDGTVQMFPFLMWFPNSIREKILATRKNLRALSAFLKEQVHCRTPEIDDSVQDYLSAYMKERASGLKTSAKETFDEPQLLASVSDLFRAGTESVSTSVLWSFLFMAEHPDVTAKVLSEIDSVTGRNRTLTNADRARLPYTEAFVLEVQRCRTFAPVTLPHKTLEEITIADYVIPKGTLIVANVSSIHQDERWWKNPEEFDPSRFLDAHGRLTRPDGFSPFSVGKRACLGEGVAKMILFIFIANLLQRFSVTIAPKNVAGQQKDFSRLVQSPLPFEMIFSHRPEV